jgi:hypothetical protein
LFALASPCSRTLAQTFPADSAVYQNAFENARTKSTRAQRTINIGSEYQKWKYDPKNGHPFFQSDKILKGEIIYHEILYRDQPLQYDLLRDEVITEHVSGRQIILVREKISEFSLEGHVFRQFPDLIKSGQAKSGFFEVLVDENNVQFLAKRQKRIRGFQIEDDIKYYLVEDGNISHIKNYRQIIRLMSGQTSWQFKRENDRTREDKMIRIAKQYARQKQ